MGVIPLAGSLAAGLGACSGESLPSGGTTSGGGGVVSLDGGDASSGQGGAPVVPPDAAVIHCTLDNGTDPVGFCAQKLVLKAQHEAAFTAQKGVYSSWDSTSFAPDTGGDGAPLHDARDDVRYAASIARYHDSASRYGDTEITALLDGDLPALATVIEAELSPLPATYDGDLYQDLRQAAAGLRYVNQGDPANALDAVAEAYGRAIYSAHQQALGPGDAVLGDPAGGGMVAYSPAAVATGALALIDLALRHGAAEPESATAWQVAAAASFDHLWSRARDPSRGLFYSALVTSADPDHDAAAPGPLSTDVQATVALALLRAADLVAANPAALAVLSSAPFEAHGEALIAALNAPAAGLWDAAGTGYLEGLDPVTGAPIPGKTTRGNALLFAAVRRASLGGTSAYAAQLGPLRALLSARMPAHTSLLSVVPDQSGFFLRVPQSFDFAAGDAGAEPHERSYVSSAISAAIEGLSEGFYGLPD